MAEPSQSNLRKKCQFVVQTKKRPCRMMALAGELFCGEHIVLHPESIVQKPYPNNQIRIKCPLDPRHTCFLHKLDSHLKVCNAREKPRPPYHVRDLNAGDDTPQPDGQTIHELSDKQLLGLLDKITALYKEYVSPPEVADEASHEALAESLEDPTFGANTLKHLRQNSALLAVLRDAGQLPGPQTTFIELGSGKAQLSFWLARAVSSQSQIVLVDFASHRHKAENKLKDLKDMPEVQRLKIDIRHLSLSGCDQCRDRPVTLFSKHLCGAATDYGLRCATAVPPPDSAENAAPSSGAYASNAPSGYQPAQQSANQAAHQSGDQPVAVSGGQTSPADVRCVMIAVCCHHRVDWASYVGKHFLQDVCGFSPSDFTALKGVAAWATCGTRSWDEDPRLHGPKPRRGKRPTSPGDGDDSKRRRRSGDEATAETGEQAEAKTGDGDGKEQTKTGDGGEQVTAETAAQPTTEKGDGDGKATSQPATETDNGQTNKPEEDEDRPGPGSRDASAGRYQRLGLTPERRTDVGFQCKRLLDEGRRRFLQERGFTARLVRYVPPDVSPENVLLLATR